MDRTVSKDRLLARLAGRGLEIGAFHHPMPVPDGVSVRYVDRYAREHMELWYPEAMEFGEPVVPSIIAPADDLSMLASASEDFVLASHLLEHLADPRRALSEWHRVLKPGGWLLLVLPDQRFTFDQHRQRTTLGHVLDAPPPAHDAEHYAEWAFWVNDLDDQDHALFWADLLQEVAYPIHFHCWQPQDFLDLIPALRAGGGPAFELVEMVTGERAFEFALLLRKV